MTDIAAGVALMIAGFFYGLRVIFLDPDAKGWPPAPNLVRVSMFFSGALAAAWGVEVIGKYRETGISCIGETGTAFLCSLAVCTVVMWINVLRQRYPAVVWNRVERIMTLANCRNGRTLVELARAGFYVFLPGRPGDPEPIGPADIADPVGLPPSVGR